MMAQRTSQLRIVANIIRKGIAVFAAVLLLPGDILSQATQVQQQPAAASQEGARIPAEQLDSLVAPIALYADPLLSQTLVASTYPLEIIQLQQWLQANPTLKDKALTDAVMKQGWDPSIQALAALPDVVKRLSENIKWTTDLGNAFLAQQSDVMDAVQRMRAKAKGTGNLKSTEQQKVETQVVENKQVIVIQQASPEVIYVPSYSPTVVYGPPVYPYPPIYYPPPGYYAAGMAISFGIGIAMGAAWGGGWGYGCGWGHNDITINNNNNFVNNSNRQNIKGGNRASTQPARGNSNWQHNPQHRGGAPYSNRATATQYGGTTRGDSMSTRQAQARQDQARQGNRQQAGVSDRSASARDTSRSGGGDRVGNRSVSSGSASRSSSAFGGGSGGSSRSGARASSSRGSSSMGGSRGGGGRRR